MKLSPVLKRSWQNMAERCHQHVDLAESYLTARGLWDSGVVEEYCLGVVAEPTPEYEFVAGRLCIPYLTPTGVVNLKFRCIQDHKCKQEGCRKYLGLPGADDRVYNVQALHDARERVFLSEGELDALCASVVGFPTAGISGASKWQSHYARLLEDFDEVVVLAEGDDGGREFGKRARSELDNARVVQLPEGEDVNSLLAREDYTVDDFAKLVG